jgi:hypothetical protein
MRDRFSSAASSVALGGTSEFLSFFVKQLILSHLSNWLLVEFHASYLRFERAAGAHWRFRSTWRAMRSI